MEKLFKKTVFITGITGFTGKHLEFFLKNQGFLVYGTSFGKSKNPHHFECDVTDKKQVRDIFKSIKPDYIIHTAAISFVADIDQKRMYDVNIFGTLNVLDSLLELEINPKKIIVVSSAAVYGNIREELTEYMCAQPINHYGNSKLGMENMTKNYFSRLNILIVRPFNYTGIGQDEKFLIPKIIKHYKENKEEISLGNIDVYREFNSVDFIVNSYIKLLVSDANSQIINVCSGKVINIDSILRYMAELTGRTINVSINPEFVRKNEIKTLKGSPDKLFSIVGDFTSEFTLKDTLSKMYRQQ